MMMETRRLVRISPHERAQAVQQGHEERKQRRMPRVKSGPITPWPALESCTPLGALLVEWMWRQRPPTPVAVLAARIGVDRSTLVSWLTTDRQPQPMQLLALSQVTELPVLALARAASVPEDRVLRQREALWDYVEWELRRHHFATPDDGFDTFLERLHAARGVARSGLRMEGEEPQAPA
jgi:transcriptional regulator with XRE-family HTH domain